MGDLKHSKAEINRAGETLRRFMLDDVDDMDAVLNAYRTLLEFRSAHQRPLTTAAMGLRSSVSTEGAQVRVSQRLKRAPTILDKLKREPELKLARMQDIGGCRAVLPDIATLRRVQRRLERRTGKYRRTRDYIRSPRESGYRGIHVILTYHDRDIEVQLRTHSMHDWAIAVERFGSRIGEDLKSGRGPDEVLAWLEAVSEAMAFDDAGQAVPDDLMARVAQTRLRAQPYLL